MDSVGSDLFLRGFVPLLPFGLPLFLISFGTIGRMSRPVFSKTSASVLVTDIPCTESDRRCYRDGMTADGIIRLYREEYRVEHCIRFTKSGVGIDQVFLQTPSRERAMMFVVTELTVLTSTADAVFRSKGMKLNGVQMTVNNLMQELQGTTVRLDRGEMRMFVETPQGKEIDLFEITDALQINPRLLLGYLES